MCTTPDGGKGRRQEDGTPKRAAESRQKRYECHRSVQPRIGSASFRTLCTHALDAAAVIPIHHQGWSHFTKGRREAEPMLAAAGVADCTRWLQRGESTVVDLRARGNASDVRARRT